MVTQVNLTGDAAAQWGALAFEHTIELRTGRTHQIRVQLAAAGAPLLGDHLYGTDDTAPADIPLQVLLVSAIGCALCCYMGACSCPRMIVAPRFLQHSSRLFVCPQGDASEVVQGKRDVIQPIGLQAYQLRVSNDSQVFGPGKTCFTAPTPWWRV